MNENLTVFIQKAACLKLDRFKCEWTYFDRFGVEHIPQEIKKLKGKKIITTNIYRMIGYGSIMYGYFCIGLIDSMLRVKT